MSLAVDFVTEAQIKSGVLSQYQVLYLPHVELMGAPVAHKIKEFVRDGGRVWADGRCAFLDEHVYLRHAIPGHGLDELFGCKEADFIAARDEVKIDFADGATCFGYRHAQYLEPTTGTTVATFANGRPAVVSNDYGDGLAELAGSYLTLGLQKQHDEATMDYVAGFAIKAGIEPKVHITPRTGFEVCLLVGPQYDVMTITNHTGEEAEAKIAAPLQYTAVSCPMDDRSQTVLADGLITRVFAELETVVIFCRKPEDEA